MNKTQKLARRQERHELQKNRRLEKKKELQAKQDSPEEEDEVLPGEELDIEAGDDVQKLDEEEEKELESVKKDYGDVPVMMQPMEIGPTSWETLDAQEAAEDQADALREISWDVRELVYNIMNSDSIAPIDKAQAIQDVGSELGNRVKTIMAATVDNPGADDDGEDMMMQKDMDLLTLEALIATDNRNTPLTERAKDWITKAALSYAAKQSKPDSAYALVVTRGKTKVRKYLIHDKAHVRNALARAAQGIKAGGQAASDAKAALPKIHAAAKRMGIGAMKKEGAILIEKDAKGDWRWVGIPSNNFVDWHNDIISKDAHEEYVAFLEKNADMAPVFMSWHTPGTERKNPVDYCAFENGFLIMSGKLEEAEAAHLLKAQADTEVGMSFQGFGLRESNDPRVVTKYRMFEVSDLPLENAANPFTDLNIISKEVDMNKEEYLAGILGSPEKAKAFLQKTGLKQEALKAAGVESKEKTPEPKIADKVETVVINTQAAKPGDNKALVEAVLKELDVEGLNAFVLEAKEAIEKVPVLEALVKEMQGNADQQLADKINPPASRFAWATKARASEAEETKVKENDPLKKKLPGLGDNWLSEVTNTAPIAVEQVRA